jgi:hypothetical protein
MRSSEVHLAAKFARNSRKGAKNGGTARGLGREDAR